MIDLSTVRLMLEYADWGNGRLLECAAPLADELLDRQLEIGPGTLRRIVVHIWAAEMVWLRRQRGFVENVWPNEKERVTIERLRERLTHNATERDAWLNGVSPGDVGLEQTYRDSKGSLFRATLGEMLMQGVMHTKHHQAQAVNALRRLGAEWPELDYMYRVRRPAE